MSPEILLEIAEGLMQLDPVRSYPQRSVALVARLAHVQSYRLELDGTGARLESDPTPPARFPDLSVPVRTGRDQMGTVHFFSEKNLSDEEMRFLRWGVKVMARCLSYCDRLSGDGGRRGREEVEAMLQEAPLTPRERDVVGLLVGGASTRQIASKTGLTVATVNTYLKRIFSKLGVHSRVELVARFAGTENLSGAAASKRDGKADDRADGKGDGETVSSTPAQGLSS